MEIREHVDTRYVADLRPGFGQAGQAEANGFPSTETRIGVSVSQTMWKVRRWITQMSPWRVYSSWC